MNRMLFVLIGIFAGTSLSFAAPKGTLVVVSGGFGSCKVNGDPNEMGMWSPLRSALQSSQSADVMRVCYAIGAGTIYWDKVFAVDRYNVRRGWDSGSFQDVLGVIKTTGKDYSKIIFVGQSYGAHLAMMIQQNISYLLDQQVLLLTVDAISQRDCTPSVFTTSWMTWSPAPECTRFPRLAEATKAAIRNNVTGWTNFFQTQYKYLHSGSVAQADENIHIKFLKEPSYAVGGHKAIEFEPQVWRLVKETSR